MQGKLVKRSDKVIYYGIPDAENPGESIYTRMKGFTEGNTSKNPKEYARQYIDEPFEQSDVNGYSPSIGFKFDKYDGDPVHDDITEIIDNELLGDDAVRPLLVIDMLKDGATEINASRREYSVIADAEGDTTDAYTYSGNFKTKGEKVWGKAVLSADKQTATFTPAE